MTEGAFPLMFRHPFDWRPSWLASVAIIAVLMSCSTAGALSLVYIQDSNVWIGSPDGTTRRQVTTNGTAAAAYYSPSQADNGTIVVGWGARLYTLDQTGNLIGPPIPTVVSDKAGNVYAAGPFNPRVSADGMVVAYWIGLTSGSYDPGCDCYLTSPVENVVYARADGSGTIGFSRFWQTPSWIDNGHVLLFAPGNRQTPQVGVADLAALGSEQGWFNDDGAGYDGYWQDLDDGEIDRAGRKLALVRGVAMDRLSVYAVTDFSTPPVLTCEGGGPSGAFSGPTWSPDGRALAWYENDGIWTSPVPAQLTGDAPCAEFAPQLLLPGASQPRWGVADVSAPVLTATPTAVPSSTAAPTRTHTPLPTATATRSPSPESATPTATAPPSATATAVETSAPTQSPTESRTIPPASTPTPTEVITPTETPAVAVCMGDCNGSREVTINELILLVNIALGAAEPAACANGIPPAEAVDIAAIVHAVNNALNGCPGALVALDPA